MRTEEDFFSQPDLDEHTGLLLAEEASLKKYLSGLEVPDKSGGSSAVPVYFRWPDSERRMKYPFITIDLLNISPAYDRWQSVFNQAATPAYFVDDETGAVRVGQYYPSQTYDAIPDPDIGYYIERYQPYTIMFQVSTYCRSIQHDRFMVARFLTDIFPPRSFFIGVDADHTWRRGELLEWISGDTLETTEASKRIFRKIYTVAMEAEIPTSQIYELEKVRNIHVDVYDRDIPPAQKLAVGHPSDSPAHEDLPDYFTI